MVQVRRPPKAGQDPAPAPTLTHLNASPHFAARLDADTIARIDALIERMSVPWHKATKSDVLRAVLLAGLPIVEAQFPAKKGGTR